MSNSFESYGDREPLPKELSQIIDYRHDSEGDAMQTLRNLILFQAFSGGVQHDELFDVRDEYIKIFIGTDDQGYIFQIPGYCDYIAELIIEDEDREVSTVYGVDDSGDINKIILMWPDNIETEPEKIDNFGASQVINSIKNNIGIY